MPKLRCQVVRDGAKKWMVWRLCEGFTVDEGEGREYEQIARVVLDAGLWYVELPKWGDNGIDAWDRQPRGWVLKEGAIRSVIAPRVEKKATA